MEASYIMWLVFFSFSLIVINARPQFQPPPGDFPPMPPEIERVLPADAVAKLKAIHTNPAYGFLEKQQKIDEIMTALPAEILDQIPPPPGFQKLPQEVQQQLKSINRNKELNWHQKQEKLRDLIHSLPAHLRTILMPPMPGGR